jgi:hypothetical protein
MRFLSLLPVLHCLLNMAVQAQITFIRPTVERAPQPSSCNHAISDADTLLLTPRSELEAKVTLRFVLKDVDTIPLGSTVMRDSVFMVHYPDHGYRWTGSYPNYTCTAPSMQGLAFGLYGLMDHVLGFKFIHATADGLSGFAGLARDAGLLLRTAFQQEGLPPAHAAPAGTHRAAARPRPCRMRGRT